MFFCLKNQTFYETFPPTHLALEEEPHQGLLCLSQGISLQADLLSEAYRQAIFPWSGENKNQQVAWFSPKKRPVFDVNEWQPSRSIRRTVKNYHKEGLFLTVNENFSQVVQLCSERDSTWITSSLKQALFDLHEKGLAFSFEVKAKENNHGLTQSSLIGGLYGISHYPVFFAESMFSKRSGASKYAFWGMMCSLKEKGYQLVDAQVPSAHVELLGCHMMDREVLQDYLIDSPRDG